MKSDSSSGRSLGSAWPGRAERGGCGVPRRVPGSLVLPSCQWLGCGGRGSPSGCFPHLLSKHGPAQDRKSRLPFLLPPRASSIGARWDEFTQTWPCPQTCTQNSAKRGGTGEEHQVLRCCLGNHAPKSKAWKLGRC